VTLEPERWLTLSLAWSLGHDKRDGKKIAMERRAMIRIAVLGLSLIVVGVDTGCTQDIAGIEDCTKTSGLDKRTGCLQSNVNFLQRLVTKNALDARNKLDDAASEIVALKGVVTRLQKTVEQLQAAQKAAVDKKPETK
jgi:outer membrane murein-binding lipoprotein Lpp